MFCPSCEAELILKEIYMDNGDLLIINLCERCSGFWIENYNMQKIFNMKNFPASKIPAFYPVEGLDIIEEGKRHCPLCGKDLVVLKKKGFNLEICRDCNGLWLDIDKLKALYYVKKRIQQAEEKNNIKQTTDITSLSVSKYSPRKPFACYHDEVNQREAEKKEVEVMPDYESKDDFMYDNISNACDFVTDIFIDPHDRYGIERNKPRKRYIGEYRDNDRGFFGNLYDLLKPNDYD